MTLKRILLALLLFTIVVLLLRCQEPYEPTPIKSADSSAKDILYQEFVARPIPWEAIPQHPFMAQAGQNSMHSDGYSSDAHPYHGPTGNNTQKVTRVGSTVPGGQCATLTVAQNSDLLALCTGITGFRLHRLKARTLELLAEYKLPQRPSSIEALVKRDSNIVMHDSSGAYFYLDQLDRIVMADADKIIHRIGSRQDQSGDWEFHTDKSWSLAEYVPDDCVRLTNWSHAGECDLITAVMPDFNGVLWWATRAGRVGTVNQDTDEIFSLQLNAEEIQNGFSVAQDGVYIVSDHAMYGFETDAVGKPSIMWREEYDRGTSRRLGTINQGSGTTPSLMMDKYVTITDNADERMNLVIYQRQKAFEGNREVCAIPLFESGHSVTDNSMIAIGRSILLENNAGYSNAMNQSEWSNAGGGIVRVDVREDESGCDIVWQSSERSPSVVPKLSLLNGVAYFYTYEHQKNGINDWFLMGLDYRSGETLFKLYTGSGTNFDNNWAPISLAPDGTAYVGTKKGLIALWDGE